VALDATVRIHRILFSGAAAGAPFSALGKTPELDEARVPLAAQGEQLLLDLQDAN
jgi:hypothetical protein